MLAFVTFVLLATFPGWHVETNQEGSDVDVKPFPKRAVSQAALAFVFIAAVFVLVSLLNLNPPIFFPLLRSPFRRRQCFVLANTPHPPGLGALATHSLRRRSTNSARFRKWQCNEWCRIDGDDIGVVWVRAVGDCDDWFGDDDLDSQVAE